MVEFQGYWGVMTVSDEEDTLCILIPHKIVQKTICF